MTNSGSTTNETGHFDQHHSRYWDKDRRSASSLTSSISRVASQDGRGNSCSCRDCTEGEASAGITGYDYRRATCLADSVCEGTGGGEGHKAGGGDDESGEAHCECVFFRGGINWSMLELVKK